MQDVNNEDSFQDIDYDAICSGPLYFDKRNLKPGYVPCWVADRPGEYEKYKKMGYETVIDDFAVGDNIAAKTSKFGSAVTVQSKCGTLLVLMAVREELFKKRMAYEQRKANKQSAGLGYIDGVPPEHQQIAGVPIGEYKETKR